MKVNDDAGTTSHVFPSVQVDKHGSVFVAWLDRRDDPVNNLLTNTWADVSHDNGLTFGQDQLQSDVATTWFVRRDARPNFGDYNSSELLDFEKFVTVWADGRFPVQNPLDPTLISFQRRATPGTIFTIENDLFHLRCSYAGLRESIFIGDAVQRFVQNDLVRFRRHDRM